jgi:predicted RNA binding protein YcfA (HicA-like mRNA interferase family)
MPKLAGINHPRAVKAFQKAGFVVIREGKHISMAKDDRIIITDYHHPAQQPD